MYRFSSTHHDTGKHKSDKGGRSTELFPDGLDDELLCCICHDVLVDPVDTPCGHVFCQVCIMEALRRGNSVCPMDRNPLDPNHLRESNVAFKNMLGKLVTLCDHSSIGCKWKDRWSLLRDHIEKDCHYTPISCDYGCAASFRRKDFPSHRAQCSYGPQNCEHCKKVMQRREIPSHLDQCEEFPIRCDCQTVVPRRLFLSHRQAQCPESLIDCEYGCGQFLRKAMTEHNQLTMEKHLLLVKDMLSKKSNYIPLEINNWDPSKEYTVQFKHHGHKWRIKFAPGEKNFHKFFLSVVAKKDELLRIRCNFGCDMGQESKRDTCVFSSDKSPTWGWSKVAHTDYLKSTTTGGSLQLKVYIHKEAIVIE